MSIPVTYNFDPSAMVGTLESLKAELDNPTAPGMKQGMLAAGTTFLLFIQRRFFRLSRGGGVWPRLKASTVRQKGGDRRILRSTDSLVRSLQPRGVGNVLTVDRRGVRIGTLIPYAKYHQTGTSKMRKRQIFVRPDTETRQQMQGDIRRAIKETVKNVVIRSKNRARK